MGCYCEKEVELLGKEQATVSTYVGFKFRAPPCGDLWKVPAGKLTRRKAFGVLLCGT